MSHQFAQTPLTRVRRAALRADYDRETVHAILDSAYVCHIAFAVDGQPHCIPTAHWRIGDTLHIHGSNGSRLLRALAEGAAASVCVSHVDGLVLARSAFHHSMNYRSAMIYGRFEPVVDEAEKMASLVAFMEKVSPARWPTVRPPNSKEMAATFMLAMPIVEAVAKLRSGPPIDDEADMDWPVWAGVMPLETRFGEPIAAVATPTVAV
ncbi:pyridoxamine 5'-phosphate oxidase family protein [Chitinimonas arctica]|uniref:Pyridoxamine 5'-phosphate oxidase family protein n=1 Tax=Chitinimonas arctica TaxID=2594795 RepID=A0A516SDA5_9NEIS|nr:pyridoxamine 5'-phosphate oxidase family protein [Chitinimonas arctica]QDQ26126.1 pyridoxamine 5'-phosphate oxidase family protein [Chitinimonas arctica]